MTKSIRKGRAHYVCEFCGRDKSLSDFYWWEATESWKDTEIKKSKRKKK